MERALRRSIVAAMAVHAALAFVVTRVPAPDPAPTPTPSPFDVQAFELQAFEIEPIDEPLAEPASQTSPPAAPTNETKLEPSPKHALAPHAAISEGDDVVAIPVPSADGSSSAPLAAAPPTKSNAPFDPLAAFDPSGKTWVSPIGAGAKLDPAPPTDVKSKNEALAAKVSKDVSALVDAKSSAGSNFGGPVVSAAHDVAMSPWAPDVGVAVFVVRTDASGSVTSVSVRDVSSDLVGWAAVGKKLQSALAAKKLVVPGGAGGVEVTVKVSAKYALPSGADPKKPVSAGFGGTSGGPGISGTFDLSDIGSKPMRVVAVVVVDEGRL